MKTSTIEPSVPYAPSELIISPQGSIYHLDLQPHQIARNIILVGDQERVGKISKHFDRVDHIVSKREFVTHTGYYQGKHISVLSTGIGCDNIDIVINELDALVNIDFTTRLPKKEKTTLNLIRLGTSGALQEDIPVDSFVISTHGLGFDGLLHFYNCPFEEEEQQLQSAFNQQIQWPSYCNTPYFVKGNQALIDKLGKDMIQGITATASGFYGPQGRTLRLQPGIPDLNEQLQQFSHSTLRITNFEMETSALYGLSGALEHNACTVCAIIANRFSKTYSDDYKKAVASLIEVVLERI